MPWQKVTSLETHQLMRPEHSILRRKTSRKDVTSFGQTLADCNFQRWLQCHPSYSIFYNIIVPLLQLGGEYISPLLKLHRFVTALKSPTLEIGLSISSCSYISFCLKYFDALLFGSHTVRIVTLSWRIEPFNIV